MPVHRLQRHAARHIPRVNGALPERVAQHFRFGEQDHVILERIASRARTVRPLDRDVLIDHHDLQALVFLLLLRQEGVHRSRIGCVFDVRQALNKRRGALDRLLLRGQLRERVHVHKGVLIRHAHLLTDGQSLGEVVRERGTIRGAGIRGGHTDLLRRWDLIIRVELRHDSGVIHAVQAYLAQRDFTQSRPLQAGGNTLPAELRILRPELDDLC